MPKFLTRGQRLDLIEENRTLAVMNVGFGSTGGGEIELEASAFLLGADDRVSNDEDFVFRGNPQNRSGSVERSSKKFSFDGYTFEEIRIFLLHVPSNVKSIVLAMSIRDAAAHNQSFAQVRGAHLRLEDEASAAEMIRYELDERFSSETAVIVGRLRLTDAATCGWEFQALGDGVNGGLEALCEMFGVSTPPNDFFLRGE